MWSGAHRLKFLLNFCAPRCGIRGNLSLFNSNPHGVAASTCAARCFGSSSRNALPLLPTWSENSALHLPSLYVLISIAMLSSQLTGAVPCEANEDLNSGSTRASTPFEQPKLIDRDTDDLIGNSGQWHDFCERVRSTRRLLDGGEATLSRTAHSVAVRFIASDSCDLFEVLVSLLAGISEAELGHSDNSLHDNSPYRPIGALAISASDAHSSSGLYIDAADRSFQVRVFLPRVGPFAPEFSFERTDRDFNDREMDAIVDAYTLAQASAHHKQIEDDDGYERADDLPQTLPRRDAGRDRKGVGASSHEADRELNQLGVTVYRSYRDLTWSDLAGYDDVKRKINDTLTLALMHPEVYDQIAKQTRQRFQSNRPKAVLFEGPPGCGKTTSGKILASQAKVPFVHVPLEAIVSKWYGESERKLAEILAATTRLGECLVFIDEIDSLGTSRSQDSHETSRRMLSVLLRFIDGLEDQHPGILVAATNRKADLDSALISRFDVIIRFDSPDEPTRAAILRLYAKHLNADEIANLAARSKEMSGRNLLDACEEAERECAGRLIRREVSGEAALPTLQDYLTIIEQRSEAAAHD